MRNIPKKEDLFTEFKSDTKEKNGLPDSELIDAVVGMTNAEGGILYLGVEDDGEIIMSYFVNTKKSTGLRCISYTACLYSSSLHWKDSYISSGTL